MKNKLLITTALVAVLSTTNVIAADYPKKIAADETVEINGETVAGNIGNTALVTLGTASIKNSKFVSNKTIGDWSGAIFNVTGPLTVDNTEFDSNQAEWGGALTAGTEAVKTVITNSKFINNTAKEIGAVGLFSTAEISNTIFSGNQATSDASNSDGSGAVFLGAVSKVVFNNVTFENNTSAARAGAIGTRSADLANNSAAKVDILNSIFRTNTAATNGGALDNFLYSSKKDDTAVYIDKSTFEANSANNGGAVYNHGEKDKGGKVSSMIIANSSFTDNTATSNGGAIYNMADAGLTFSGNNVFSGNKANGELNDIHNLGNINVEGRLELDGGITGTGTIDFKDGSSLKAALSEEATKAIITAGTIKGSTAMVLENGSTGGQIKFVGNQSGFKFADNALFDISSDNGVYTFSKKSSDEVAAAVGATGNQASTITAVTSGNTTNATFNTIANNINSLMQSGNPADVKTALDASTALAPEAAPAVQSASTETTNQVFGAVGTRLSGGSISTGSEGMSSGDDIFERVAVWVQGMFNKSKLDDTSKAKGFDSDSNGVAFGIEKNVTNETKLGIGYAYTNTDIDGFMRKTDVDTHTAIVYGEYKPSRWFVNGIATYGWSDYSENKNVAGTGVKADYDVDTFGLQAMTGYDMNIKGFGVTPEAGLRYVHIKQDSYKDSTDQKVSGNDSDILTGVIGAKVSKNFELSNGTTFKPEARVAATYDLTNDNVNSVVTLANGSAYAVKGKALDRFGMEFGAGVTTEVNDNVELSLGYEGKFRQDYQDHTGLINAKYKF